MSNQGLSLLIDATIVFANLVLALCYIVSPPHSEAWIIPEDHLGVANLCAGGAFVFVASRRLFERGLTVGAKRWAILAVGALALEIVFFFLVAIPAYEALSAFGVDQRPRISFDHSYALLDLWYYVQLSLDLLAGVFVGSMYATLRRAHL